MKRVNTHPSRKHRVTLVVPIKFRSIVKSLVTGIVCFAKGTIDLMLADMFASTNFVIAKAFLTSTPKNVFNAYHISTLVQMGMLVCRFVSFDLMIV